MKHKNDIIRLMFLTAIPVVAGMLFLRSYKNIKKKINNQKPQRKMRKWFKVFDREEKEETTSEDKPCYTLTATNVFEYVTQANPRRVGVMIARNGVKPSKDLVERSKQIAYVVARPEKLEAKNNLLDEFMKLHPEYEYFENHFNPKEQNKEIEDKANTEA